MKFFSTIHISYIIWMRLLFWRRFCKISCTNFSACLRVSFLLLVSNCLICVYLLNYFGLSCFLCCRLWSNRFHAVSGRWLTSLVLKLMSCFSILNIFEMVHFCRSTVLLFNMESVFAYRYRVHFSNCMLVYWFFANLLQSLEGLLHFPWFYSFMVWDMLQYFRFSSR